MIIYIEKYRNRYPYYGIVRSRGRGKVTDITGYFKPAAKTGSEEAERK